MKDDDQLLRALGKVAAEQSAERARWEAPAVSEGASDERDELARRLFAPASEASVERMAARVAQSIATPPGRTPSRVAPIRGRALRWTGLIAAPLAAAAAIALLLTRPAGDLPGYAVSVSGGLRADRGTETRAPTDPVVVNVGTEIVLVARPEASAPAGAHAATFLVSSGAFTAVPSTSQVSAQGSLRVSVRGDDVAKVAARGASVDLVLVVDRAAGDDPRALAAGDGSTREWTRFTVPVRVAGPGH